MTASSGSVNRMLYRKDIVKPLAHVVYFQVQTWLPDYLRLYSYNSKKVAGES